MRAPQLKEKSSRGLLRQDTIEMFVPRVRKLLTTDGQEPFAPFQGANAMHVDVKAEFPGEFEFPRPLGPEWPEEKVQSALTLSLQCLARKGRMQEPVGLWLEANVRMRSDHEVAHHQ